MTNVKIADLVRTVKLGGSSYYLREGNVPARVIKHSNVDENGIIDLASVDLGMICASDRTSSNLLEPGDLLIACRGSPKIAVVPEEAKGYYFSAEFFALSLKVGNLSPTLLAEYLSSKNVQNYLLERSGENRMYKISKDDILELKVILPSKDKQDRLEELATLIQEKYQVIDQEKRCLEMLKENLIAALVGDDGAC